jgi:hypothetical protein
MRESPWTKHLRKLIEPAGAASGRRRGQRCFIPVVEKFEPRLTPAAPSVVSINRVGAAISNAKTLDFAVTFSKPVVGVDAADFQVVTTGSVASTSLQVTGSAASYTVTIDGIAGSGTLGLNLVDDNSIHDADGTLLYSGDKAAALKFFASTQTDLAAGIALADFNADGKLDVAMGDGFSTSGGIILGNGDGTFRPLSIVKSVPNSFAVADFNLDSKPDLVGVSFSNQSGNGGVLLGNGNGTFQNTRPFVVDPQSGPIAAADLNGDGKPDVVTGSTLGRMSVLLGNGDGTFQPRLTYATMRATTARIADVNNDQKPDIIIANQRDDLVGVYLGNGNGTFQAPRSVSIGFVQDIALADVNGDGALDLLATNAYNAVYRSFGSGDGSFQTPTLFQSLNNPGPVAAADFNGDGIMDIVAGKGQLPTASSAGILFGREGGDYAPEVTFAAGFPLGAIAVADINNDTRPDLIGLNPFNGRNVVFLVNGKGDSTGQTFTIDQLGPVATITAFPPANTLRQTATFAFAATDPIAGAVASGIDHLEYQIDGGAFIAAPGSASFAGLSGGSHTLAVRGVDKAGNAGPVASYSWLVDVVSSPSIESIVRVNPTTAPVNADAVSYTVTFNAVVTGVDPNDFTAVTSGPVTAGAISVAGSGDAYTVTIPIVSGDGAVQLRVNDDDSIVSAVNSLPLGGTGANGGAIGPSYSIDRTGPVTTINSQPALVVDKRSVSFAFTAVDPTVGGVTSGVHHFEYGLDGGAFTTATSPLNLTNLAFAPHTLQIRAVDTLGNIGAPAVYSWTIVAPPGVQSIRRTTPSVEYAFATK